jgi:hypothetical protein
MVSNGFLHQNATHALHHFAKMIGSAETAARCYTATVVTPKPLISNFEAYLQVRHVRAVSH